MIEAPHGALRRARVWDLDTRLPFPCTLEDYAAAALSPVRARYSRRGRASGGSGRAALLLHMQRRC